MFCSKSGATLHSTRTNMLSISYPSHTKKENKRREKDKIGTEKGERDTRRNGELYNLYRTVRHE